ncbi:uncharacterized protein OCT59_011867 [Rhizophagus irregularis]|uniref:Serine aminopeptidase S33 domain-containing protein n=4 Tax=Rhizophagus irregularis TaxID=588596 RepID=A0A915ZJW6_9GLOM|nr:hypothetical protein RirG_094890 [Rhizophagus irregularis DAOM 197198w]UZO00748.1 hypothetical protein OCT59_011867 [Rhizophagus irregularis]CAB4489871.1 unnamed protein product [Rhizophagus irregularis]CAB5377476.1 unnamed protein product [Rhizophagus irregularis]CAG8624355.1 8845_t:CDS:2 [Rhizophagus irregularis]
MLINVQQPFFVLVFAADSFTMNLQKIFKQRNFSFLNKNIINKSFTTKFNLSQFHTSNTSNKETIFIDSSDNVKIEVIHYPPTKQTNYPPLLFIHGAFLAAWSWENFSNWFSNKGYECFSLSFRGNGQSTKTPIRDKFWTLEELVNDISSVTDEITEKTKEKPILVGHSMGGGLTQKYLQDNHHKVSGGVLLASVSPLINKSGIFSSKVDWLTIKALLTLNPYLIIETPELMKKAFFSKAFPDSMAKEIHPKLDKNCSVVGLAEFSRSFVDYKKIKCPMIVIGAGEDALADNLKHVEETAEAYGVGYDMIEGSGHEVMLDLKWEDASNVIFNRIQERILNKK